MLSLKFNFAVLTWRDAMKSEANQHRIWLCNLGKDAGTEGAHERLDKSLCTQKTRKDIVDNINTVLSTTIGTT